MNKYINNEQQRLKLKLNILDYGDKILAVFEKLGNTWGQNINNSISRTKTDQNYYAIFTNRSQTQYRLTLWHGRTQYVHDLLDFSDNDGTLFKDHDVENHYIILTCIINFGEQIFTLHASDEKNKHYSFLNFNQNRIWHLETFNELSDVLSKLEIELSLPQNKDLN